MRLPLRLLLSAVVATPLAAQQQPATIPTDLATALVGSESGMSSGGIPLFSVGRAPERFPAALIPPKPAVVVGGMWLGAGGTLVVEYPGQQDAVALVERVLADAGWTSPAPVTSSPSTGFTSPSSGFFRSGYYCKGAESVNLRQAYSASGSGVRITYTGAGSMMGPCDMRRGPTDDALAQRLTFPALNPPVGATSRPAGASSGSDYVETRARITGPQSAAEVLSHYGAQLERAGWKGEAVVEGGGVAIRPFGATDARGQPWRGSMMVLPISAVERDVFIRMTRER